MSNLVDALNIAILMQGEKKEEKEGKGITKSFPLHN